MKDIDTAKFFLHPPATAASSYVEWAEKLANEPGITFGCVLDKYIIPLHPGDLMAVLARPGHGKSSFMAYMAKREADNIIRCQAAEKEAVVYVSWEQPIEEIEAFFQAGREYSSSDMAWGRVSLDIIKRQAVKRAGLPVWTVGMSLRHANIEKPALTFDRVYQAIESMADNFGIRPTLVCLDYIQIAPAGGHERRDQVSEATYEAKRLAMQIGAPIIAGVQATRQVDSYAAAVPTMADAQWSSAIEQTADKQISLWRPIKKVAEGEQLDLEGTSFTVTEDLLVIKLLKQRFERGYGVWGVHFRPETLEMHDYERRPSYATVNGHRR